MPLMRIPSRIYRHVSVSVLSGLKHALVANAGLFASIGIAVVTIILLQSFLGLVMFPGSACIYALISLC